MAKVTEWLRNFFDPLGEGEEDLEVESREGMPFPLDESSKLLRAPGGVTKRASHRFRTVSSVAGAEGYMTEVLPLDDEARALLEIARVEREKAYCRYSGFAVGAALVGVSDTVYLGVNIENASYPAGLCAERAAIASAISSGEREFTAIAIVGGEEPCFPCGICRQVLSEFCKPDFAVILTNGIYPLRSLLPHAFSL